MLIFRAAPRTSASWLRTRVAIRAGTGVRLYSEFTIYHDAKCPACKAAVETLVSADAPHTTMPFLKKSPQEDALLQVARVLEGGAELMLQDNSWPRVTDPKEVSAHSTWRMPYDPWTLTDANALQIANVCANNPALMQRPILVAPDGTSAVTLPLAGDSSKLLDWINMQAFVTVSEKQATEEAEAARVSAAAGTPDSFYASMSHSDDTAEADADDDEIPGSVDDAAEALKNMVMQMPESELRSAAEMMELGDMEGLDRDSLSTEELREIVLAAISSAVAR